MDDVFTALFQIFKYKNSLDLGMIAGRSRYETNTAVHKALKDRA